MKKRLLVKWAEYHEQDIEADPDNDELLMEVDVNETAPTYKAATLKGIEILGDIENEPQEKEAR